MLLGITEFTKAYLQVKDNPWPYVNLAKLVQNAKIGEGEVVELLKIANGYLPRVRLEYDRLKAELNSWEAELNSLKAAVNNTVRTYQDFCDRNLKLKKREDELQLSINELEAKEAELNEPSSQTLHVPHIEDSIPSVEEDNRKIFDTGELSYFNIS
jgi:chromosome segregation ATPase